VRDCLAMRREDAMPEQCIEMLLLEHLDTRQVAELMALLIHPSKG
jgi:hypothetical protein